MDYGAAAGGYGMSGLGALDGVEVIFAPLFSGLAHVMMGAGWLLGLIVKAAVGTVAPVRPNATFWDVCREHPKEAALALGATTLAIGTSVWATFIRPGQRAAARQRAREAKEWQAERDAEREREHKANEAAKARKRAKAEALEAQEAGLRERHDAWAALQPPKPLGGLSGACAETILALAAQPKLNPPSEEEFPKSLCVEAGPDTKGCDGQRETPASFQRGRRWPATSLALAIGEDTVYAGEGCARPCGTMSASNGTSHMFSWPEWKDPAQAEPGGRRIAAFAARGGARTATMEGHAGGISALVISRDGGTLYSASADRTIKAWSLASGECVSTFGEGRADAADLDPRSVQWEGWSHSEAVDALALSADGRTLFSADGTAVAAWALPEGRLLGVHVERGSRTRVDALKRAKEAGLAPGGRFVGSLLASVDGRRLYSWVHAPRCGPASGADDYAFGMISVLMLPEDPSADTGSRVCDVSRGCEWSPLDACRVDRFLTDAERGKSCEDAVLDRIVVSALAESKPSGVALFAGVGNDIARVPVETAGRYAALAKATKKGDVAAMKKYEVPWRGRAWKGSTWIAGAHDGGICALVVSADGGTLFSASADHTVKAWSLPSSEADDARPACTATLADHTGPILALQLSRNGKRLVSAAHDSLKGELTIKLWA